MSVRYQGIERDENNAVVPGARIYVLDASGATLQSLTDDFGNAMANPVTSDDTGGFYFNVANAGTYFLKHYWGTYPNPRTLELIPVGVAADAAFKGDKGDKGDTGGNIMAVGLASSLTGMASPAGTTLIATSGNNQKGLGQARYKLLDPVTDATAYNALSAANTVSLAGQNIWWFQLTDGKRAVLAEPEPFAEMFGAVGDATYNSTTGLWSGTDNTTVLQSWLDYCTYVARCVGRIGSGAFLHTATLHGGYGDAFVSTKIKGAGWRYGGAGITGTAFVNNFSDRPALNFAGQRYGSIEGATFVGSFYKSITDGHACSHSIVPSFDDTVMRSWLPATADARALNRYSTYAAITIDGFNDNQGAISGTDPETGLAYTTYVTPTWPAWTGLAAGRGAKGLSSGMTIDCQFRGFGAAMIVQPGNTDGNGDFIWVRSSSVDYCVYAFSYCNSQGRNQQVGNISGGTTWCAIATNRHGRQNGRLGGTLESISFSGLMRLMEIGSVSIVTSTIFQQVYIEGGWQLGTCSGSGANEGEMTIASGTISLALQDSVGRGVPPYVWGLPTSANGATAGLRISSGAITDFPYTMDFRTTNLRLDGVTIRSARLDAANGSTIPPFMAHVANATLGITVPSLNGRRAGHRLYVGLRNLSTGAFISQALIDHTSKDIGTRDIGLPIWVRGVVPSGTAPYDVVNSLPSASTIAPTGLTITSDASVLAGDNAADPIRLRLEGNIGAGNDASFAMNGGCAGSVIRHRLSGMAFAIYSYDNTTGAFKARALTNYRLVGGTYQTYDGTIIGATDQFDAYYSGWSTPTLPSYATYASGSTSVTAFQRGTGTSIGSTEVANGDRIFVNPNIDTQISYLQNLISALDLAAKTFTLPANALASATRQRVTGILRAPPANL